MVPVKYMLLIYSNPESWASLSAEQRDGLTRAHETLSRELTEQGLLVSAAGLADPITTRTVQVRDDTTMTTDGPYAEAKDLIGGYTLVQAKDIAEAARLAAGCPIFDNGGFVEVRPIMQMSM